MYWEKQACGFNVFYCLFLSPLRLTVNCEMWMRTREEKSPYTVRDTSKNIEKNCHICFALDGIPMYFMCQTRRWNGFSVIILYLLRCMKISLDCHPMPALMGDAAEAVLCKQKELRANRLNGKSVARRRDRQVLAVLHSVHRVNFYSIGVGRMCVKRCVGCTHSRTHTHSGCALFSTVSGCMSLMVWKFMEHFSHFKFQYH